MNNLPRQKLREIIKQYGQNAVDDSRLCRALLLDFCGGHRREIFVLNTAQEERVAEDLQDIPNSVPLAVLVAQLTQRLVDNRALDESAARWAVESWAYALSLDIDNLPQSEPPPVPPSDTAVNTVPPVKTESTKSKSSTEYSYTSTFSVEVYGRPRSKPDDKWQKLGTTPGAVRVSQDYALGLRPSGITENELADWISNIPYPLDVTSLALNGAISDSGLAVLKNLPDLTYLEINKGEAITDKSINALTHLSKLITLNLAWCTRITDDGLTYLRALSNLENLSISWSKISDTGLSHLRHLTNLHTLALRECKRINGNGFAHLKKLPQLTTLELPGCTGVNDSGLRTLGNLTGLLKLDLSRCPNINEQGFISLRTLGNLRYLDVSRNTQIGDKELAPFCNIARLSTLHLSHTRITDRGLGHIGDMFNLIYLDISRCTSITNDGLRHLNRLNQLAYLNVTGCPNITKRGIARLERPDLYISH